MLLHFSRTPESLYQELVGAGIIVQFPRVRMRTFQGEYSYLGTTLRQVDIEPTPSLGDIRRVITEYGILHLGSQSVHERAPLVKSLLLVGPKGVGKRMLANIICTETGAVMFDLTASNIVGKYPGKKGLEMMMHLVYKVGKLYQPSVIFIGNAGTTFLKKVPKTDTTDPKRLKKDLPKLMKRLLPEDRILLLGITDAPFDSELKSLTSVYQKIIMIPRPDYATRFVMWRNFIEKTGGCVKPSFDMTSLAKISDGYTAQQIKLAVSQVLTDRRLAQQERKPLVTSEFVAPLARMDPIYREEEEMFKNWFSKTPIGKKRAKLLSGELDEELDKKAKGKKGRGKAK